MTREAETTRKAATTRKAGTTRKARTTRSVAVARSGSRESPEARLKRFIDKFEPAHRRIIRGVRRALRKRFPTAIELAYDNYNFFVIGYSPSPRPSDAIISIAAAANGVGLCFIHGARLSDPTKILMGAGKQTRFLRLKSAATLARSEVEDLLAAAVADAKVPFPPEGCGELVIRSVSAKQRTRRKPGARSG
jgi:hypothetical protein